MKQDDPKQTLCLALSYRERVSALVNECEGAFATLEIDAFRHESLKKSCAVHARRAERAVAALQEAQARNLARLQRELRQLSDRQSRLGERAGKGLVTPAEANEENRALARDLAALNKRARTAKAMVEAKRAADLGNPIDLSPEEFAAVLDSEGASKLKRPSRWLGPAVALVIAGVFAVTGLAIVGLQPGAGRATFKAVVPDAAGNTIEVTCRNEGSRPVLLYVPWPEGGAGLPANASSGSAVYGIQVMVSERGKGEMRVLPNTQGCWRYLGLLMIGKDRIEIQPGLHAAVEMDLRRISDLGVDAQAVRLLFRDADGNEVGRFETFLP